MSEREILNIEEAAELLGVSIKTFNKVLHEGDMPARKIGREWKFSRRALIDWVGGGRARDFYNASIDGDEAQEEITPAPRSTRDAAPAATREGRTEVRRTAGWQIEHD